MLVQIIRPEGCRKLMDEYHISCKELMRVSGLGKKTIENYIFEKKSSQNSTKMSVTNGIIFIIAFHRNDIHWNKRANSIQKYRQVIDIKYL